MREGHHIRAPAPGHEPDLAASAHAVDGEKYLVPRQIGALPHDLFKVARARVQQDVDHLIFHGRMLCHVQPLGEQSELLQKQ